MFRVYNGVADTTVNCSCSLDQTQNGGAWQYCCTTILIQGNNGVVKLGNENTDTNEAVIVDGVRFVRESKDKDDIVDEAGIDWHFLNTANILSSTDSIIISRSLTTPSGYVVVNASGYICGYDSGEDAASCSITTGSTVDSIASFYFTDGVTAASQDCDPFGATRGFNVSSGTITFNLVCKETAGNVQVHRPHMTAIFSSTQY